MKSAHARLDEAPRVEAVVERADRHREQQERQPVRDHREAAERRRMELLEHDPVADHVLDVVGHHGEHERHQKRAKSGSRSASKGRGAGLVVPCGSRGGTGVRGGKG